MNTCTFVGRIGTPIEDIGTSGQAVKLRLAVDGWDSQAKAKKTTWVSLVAFAKTADTLRQFGSQGRQIAVRCKYDVQEREIQGAKRQFHQFIIDELVLLSDSKSNNNNAPFNAQPSGSGGSFGGW